MKTFYESGVFKKCKTSNAWNRRLLQYEEGIDEGEADAITQAQEQEIPVFIGDDLLERNAEVLKALEHLAKAARESAEKMGTKISWNCGNSCKVVPSRHFNGASEGTDPQAAP